jgi:hypothetical protein
MYTTYKVILLCVEGSGQNEQYCGMNTHWAGHVCLSAYFHPESTEWISLMIYSGHLHEESGDFNFDSYQKNVSSVL